MDEPFEIPINGVLDLHTFRPKDVKNLVTEYLGACQERGILNVRLIHGKGIGQLRQTVHSILAKDSRVESFTLDHPEYGGWGATLVKLKPAEADRLRLGGSKSGREIGDRESNDNGA